MEEETQPTVDGTLLARAEQAEAEAAALRARAEEAEAQVLELSARVSALKAAPPISPAVSAATPHKAEEQKVAILKIIFIGISSLMGYLGILVLTNWYIPGSADNDGIGASYFQMAKDILLVLTGILGSAMASVFDSRSAGRSTDSKPAEQVQAQENNLE